INQLPQGSNELRLGVIVLLEPWDKRLELRNTLAIAWVVKCWSGSGNRLVHGRLCCDLVCRPKGFGTPCSFTCTFQLGHQLIELLRRPDDANDRYLQVGKSRITGGNIH